MGKTTNAKTFNVKTNTQLECEGLSDNEKIVLMYMKDQKPHDTPPKGMKADVFGVVCEMLKERKCVKELKDEGISFSLYDTPRYHITPKGYDVITLLEQEETQKEKEVQQKAMEEKKKLESIITDEELSMLFAEVVKKHPYFHNSAWSETYWNVTKTYLKKLFCQGQSPMSVYTIANELSVKDSNSRVWQQGHGYVDDGDRIAFKLYVVIYYKYKDNSSYSIMLDALGPQMGFLGSNGRFEEINKTLDAVRLKYGAEKEITSIEKKGTVEPNGKVKTQDDIENQESHLTNKNDNAHEVVHANFKIVKGRNTDFIKVMYALCECGVFEKEDGVKADIKDVMEYFGEMFASKTIKNYSSSLSEAKDKKQATFLKIIAELEKVLTDYFST